MLRRFFHEVDGKSAPEYALVIGGIVCALILIVAAVGKRAGKVYELSALQHHAPTSEMVPVPTELPAVAATSRADSQGFSQLPPAMLAVGAIQVLILVALLGYAFRRRKRPGAPAESDQWHQDLETLSSNVLRALRQHVGDLRDWELPVATAMSRNAPTLPVSARRRKLEETLNASRHGVVAIVGKHNELEGFVTRQMFAESSAESARSLMDRELRVDAKASLSAATTMMLVRGATCLPVVDGTQFVGAVTPVEIAVALRAALQILREVEMEHRKALLRTVGTG